MLFKFWVRSEMTEDFLLHLEVDATHTFFQLHELLQEECHFDPSQLASFFVADEEWDKGIQIQMFGNNLPNKSPFPVRLMTGTRINELLRSEEDKLLYTYDLTNDKSLYIELFQIKMEQTIATPTIKLRKGTAPAQEKNSNFLCDEAKNNKETQHIFDDLGELEDLYEIYGEMSNSIL